AASTQAHRFLFGPRPAETLTIPVDRAWRGPRRRLARPTEELLERVDEAGHRLLREFRLLADFAAHVDLPQLIADRLRNLANAWGQHLRQAGRIHVEVHVDVGAVEVHFSPAAQADRVAEQVQLVDADAAALDVELGLGFLKEGAIG